MADQCNSFAGIVEGFDQSDRRRTLRQIPHGTVPAHIKHSVEVFRFHIRELNRARESSLRRRVLFEPRHRCGLILRQVALRIDGWLSPFGRSERQINTSISEYKVRGGKFFQPETGLATCVAELIVRREHHQDFHVCLLVCFLPDYRLNRLRRSYNTTRAEAQTIGPWYRRYFGSSQGDERRLQAATIKMQELLC